MTTSPEPAARFQPPLIGDLDEPVRRLFTHAIRDGAPLAGRALGDEGTRQGRYLAALRR